MRYNILKMRLVSFILASIILTLANIQAQTYPITSYFAGSIPISMEKWTGPNPGHIPNPITYYWFNQSDAFGNIGYIHYLAQSPDVYWDEVYRSELVFDLRSSNIPANAVINSITLSTGITDNFNATAVLGKFPANTTITVDAAGWAKFTSSSNTIYYNNLPYNPSSPKTVQPTDLFYSDIVGALNHQTLTVYLMSNNEGNNGSNSWVVNPTIAISWTVPISVTVQNSVGGSAGNVIVDQTSYPSGHTFTWNAGTSHNLQANDPLRIGNASYPFSTWMNVSTNQPIPGNPISQTPMSNTTYQANYGQGSVGVTVYQNLSTGASTGNIGRWEGGPDFAPYSAPHAFTFTLQTTEALRGAQDIESSQKYNNWTRNTVAEPTVLNHHTFSISPNDNNFTSNFQPTTQGSSITTSLLEVPGSYTGTVAFQDPWLIDYPDPLYGNQKRNQGMSAPFKSRTTPFSPDYGTSFNGDIYKGVFLGLDPTHGATTYYSVGAPVTQSFTVNGTSYPRAFVKWTANSSATIQTATSASTPVVFTGSSAVITANYKGVHLSNNTAAFSNNSQRKFVQTPDGYMHMVYESVIGRCEPCVL